MKLRAGGRGTTLPIHRLVLEAFVGLRPDGMECRHLNGDQMDNRLSNLAWGTRAENVDDRRRLGESNSGERNGHAKLDADAVRAIRRRAAAGEQQKALAEEFGVTRASVCMIVAHRRWRHV